MGPIIFNQEVFDTDSAYDTSNGRFTVPSGKGGKYYVYTQMEIYDNIYDIIVRIRKNGSDQVSQRLKRQSDSSLFFTCSLYAGAVLDLSAGDYLDVRVRAEASGTWYTDDSSIDQVFFGGYRIIT